MALYKVEKTGYYCVAMVPAGNGSTFEAFVEWKFPYGELPATDYPKLLVREKRCMQHLHILYLAVFLKYLPVIWCHGLCLFGCWYFLGHSKLP